MNQRVLIISPVRNEAAHIERVVRGVEEQTRPPACWVVLDDGSTDGTLEILRALSPGVPFLTVLSSADTPELQAAPDRLARAAAPRAFNRALATVDWSEYTHVMKLDGDIELPADYFERLAERFAADPQLGIACGDLVEPEGDGFKLVPIPPHHVHGALKCYTRACFAEIGGVQERLGWDTIDETYARMRGFTTRSFRDIVAVHHRPLATADGALRGRARHGECAYVAHFSLLWVALRAFKIARYPPVGLSGIAFFYGFVRAACRRTERVPDLEFRRFARRELRRRLWRAAGLAKGAA
jgi:poly-beta-1,6-N-acetyl-D-glucosamine synthase